MDATPILTVPLQADDDGAIRVGKTRVLLELVIGAFRRGDSPEEIVEGYSSLTLQDVYAVIAYYLANRDEVETYMRSVKADGDRIRNEIEARETPEIKLWRARLREQLTAKRQHPL